jgi:hypothetical protein
MRFECSIAEICNDQRAKERKPFFVMFRICGPQKGGGGRQLDPQRHRVGEVRGDAHENSCDIRYCGAQRQRRPAKLLGKRPLVSPAVCIAIVLLDVANC